MAEDLPKERDKWKIDPQILALGYTSKHFENILTYLKLNFVLIKIIKYKFQKIQNPV